MGGIAWNEWPKELRKRNKKSLSEFAQFYSDEILYHQFRQFLFFRQWMQLHTYVNDMGIKIIGDIPLFVAYDSADVWAKTCLDVLGAYERKDCQKQVTDAGFDVCNTAKLLQDFYIDRTLRARHAQKNL